ncbi:MAG: hypothetical protein AAB893_02560 [Patescibacteria group bacterium]|mgnify:CR=1 FL=1
MKKKEKYLIKTQYGEYYALIWFGVKERVYFVSIPAFPDVLTEARSVAEAKKYATDVIELQCLAAIDNGKLVIDDTRRIYGKRVYSGAVNVFV